MNGHMDCIHLLVQHGAEVDAVDAAGRKNYELAIIALELTHNCVYVGCVYSNIFWLETWF